MASPPTPLYRSIGDELRRRIEQGELVPGARLPPEVELAREFGVSRQTIRAALAALARSGRLERRRGAGTIVTRPKAEQRLHRFYGIECVECVEREARGRASPLATRVLARGRLQAEDELAARAGAQLGLARPEDIGYLIRLRLAGGAALLLETIAFPAALCPALLDEPSPQADDCAAADFYDTLAARAGVRVTHAREVFRPVLVAGYEARMLGVPAGQPAFQVERTSLAAERAVEWRQTLARGDRCALAVDLLSPTEHGAPS